MNLTWLWVGVLYAIAVWIARRHFPARIGVLFYLLVLVFLWRPMTQAYVDLPVDYLDQLPPWSYYHHQRPLNREINDIPLQMIPWAHEVRQQWKSLRFPLWNPTAGSGSVLLANGQSAALSPLRLLALPLPLGQSFTAEAAMKLLIALTFAFLFCRRRGFSEIAGAAGAVSFAFATFIIVWLHFPHATVAAFLPAVLLQIDLIAEKQTFGRIAGFAVIWSASLFGGHPETALHIFILGGLMAVWIVAVERPFGGRRDAIRFLLSLAAGLALAGLIAAPLISPLAEALRKSVRYELLQAHPASVAFTDFPSSILLFQPGFFGIAPIDPTWGPAVAESICGFAGVLGFAGWIALLLDAITTKRWRTREMFFVVITPLLLAVILDWPWIGHPFNALLSIAANARVRMLLCFAMAFQAAAGIDLAERKRRLPLLTGIAAVGAALLALLDGTSFPGAWARQNAVLAMLPSVVVLAFATWTAVAAKGRGVAALFLTAAVVAELWSAGWAWNPVLPESKMYRATPMIRRLQAIQQSEPPNEPFRIVGLAAMLFPNTATLYGFEDIRAHDPMANGHYMGVLRVLGGYDSDAYFAQWKNEQTPLLNYLNVKYVLTYPRHTLPDPERFRLLYDGKDGRIYENTHVLPRFFAVRNIILEFKGDAFIRRLMLQNDWRHTAIVKMLPVVSDRMRRDLLAPRPLSAPDATASIVDAGESSFRLRIHAPRYSLIVSSVPFWPGWRIRRNGESVEPLPVNGAFLGFTVPPGDWDVEVDYFPPSFYLALAASLMTIAVLVAASLWPATRRSLRNRPRIARLIAFSIRSRRPRAEESLRSE